MSESTDQWVWQGFYDPMTTAIAAKFVTDADSRVGVWIPVPEPADLKTARHAMVGKMVGG